MRAMSRIVFWTLASAALALPAAGQVCGNGVLEPSEQCDDGNTSNGDGCSADCKFEQNQRVNQLKLQFGGTSANCTANAFGGAIVGSTAQSQVQTSTDSSIADGSLS